MKIYKASKEEIKAKLLAYYLETGLIPKYKMKSSELGVSPTVVQSVFGSWNDALLFAEIPLKINREKIETLCDTCGCTISLYYSSFVRSERHFCSQSCAATHNNTGRQHTHETKQKISGRLKGIKRPPKPPKIFECECAWCNFVFLHEKRPKKYCNPVCRNKAASKRTSSYLKENRSHIRGPHKQSYMEESFEHWLVSRGMKRGFSGYLTEVYFFNQDTGKNGWADFVFPRQKLIIELDGTQHKKRQGLDKVRDEHLVARGWSVVRITHAEYRNQTRVEEIEKMLKLECQSQS